MSWAARQENPNYPPAGGIRDRYLFRTKDGITPAQNGDYRLYKQQDAHYDGPDKIGPTHPRVNDISQQYYFLVDWYEKNCF